MDEHRKSALDSGLMGPLLTPDWIAACEELDVQLADVAEPDLARLAFRLMAAMYCRDLKTLPSCAPTQALVEQCAQLVTPLYRPEPDLVRTIYFPTRPGDVPQFYGIIAFCAFWALISRYEGPVAWLSFPLGLLGDKVHGEVCELIACVERTRLRAGALAGSNRPVTISFEDESASLSMFHLGRRCPPAWEVLANEPMATAFGLPLVCVPSRSVAQMRVSRTSWGNVVGVF